MEFMGERLAEKSGGAMRLDLYPSQQLGTERETLELLQIGSLGMTKVSSSVLENFAPTFQVLSLPFLFRDDAHRFAVLDGAENNPPSFYLSRHTESPAPDATAPPVLDA
jgi:TRAP-type C4-dicarboxylate transport system substrate-binding protein